MKPSDVNTFADVARWLRDSVEWTDEGSRDIAIRAVDVLSASTPPLTVERAREVAEQTLMVAGVPDAIRGPASWLVGAALVVAAAGEYGRPAPLTEAEAHRWALICAPYASQDEARAHIAKALLASSRGAIPPEVRPLAVPSDEPEGDDVPDSVGPTISTHAEILGGNNRLTIATHEIRRDSDDAIVAEQWTDGGAVVKRYEVRLGFSQLVHLALNTTAEERAAIDARADWRGVDLPALGVTEDRTPAQQAADGDWQPKPGDRVRTAEMLDNRGLGRAAERRRPNAIGKVEAVLMDIARVSHDDGSEAPYDRGELRPEPAERLCVAALVTDPADRVLMVRSHKRAWELPGGGVHDGEHPVAAVGREVEEETGLRLAAIATSPTEILGVPKPGASYRSRILVYRATAEGEPVAGDDAADSGGAK